MTAEQFLELAKVLPEPMLLVSSDGKILAANPSFSHLIGIETTRLNEKSLFELTTTDPDKINKYLSNCSRSRQMVLGALTFNLTNGETSEFRCEGALAVPRSADSPAAKILVRLKPKESAVSKFVLLTQKIEDLSREIVERKRAESERERISERFRLAEEASNGFIYEWSLETNQVERSIGVTKVLGYSPEEIEATPGGWQNLVHPEDWDSAFESLNKQSTTNGGYEAEYRVLHKDGRWIYIIDRGLISSDEQGNPQRVIGFSVDITERKIAERKLRENEERMRLFVEHAPASVAMLDDKMRYLAVSNRWLQDFNLNSEIIGRSHYELFPEISKEWKEVHRRCLAGAVEKSEEELFERNDGSRTWLKWEVRPWYTASDKIGGIIIFSEDIADRKREDLNREFLLNLGEKIRFGVFTPENLLDEVTETVCRHLDATRCLFIEINEAENQGKIKHEYCKPGITSVTGNYKISDYSPETLAAIKSGCTIVNFDAANDPRTADIYKTTYEPYNERSYVSIPLFTNNQWTAVLWISDARPRKWTLREIAFLEAVGERTWLAIEKLRNEEALRLSEERMRLATEAAEIYTWEFDLETQRLTYAENTERILGFSMPEDWSQASMRIYEEDRQNAVEKFEYAFANETNFNLDFRLVNPHGGNLIWQSVQGVFITNKGRKAKRFIGITQNITERKKAEQEREELLRREHFARLQAEEANRLKDEFLATVSHELRTPLNAILGWSQLLSSGQYNGGDISRPLETIYRNAKSQAQLVEDILDVSRIITGKLRLEPEPVSLSAIVQAAVETLRHALEAKSIRLQLQMNYEPWTIHADPNRLQQVIWNLLSNAIKFTPDKGTVTIGLERHDAEIKIIVSDSGKGISPEFLPFVFERFRQADGTSTRSHGGLGLGLAIVRHIVELHGGTVEVESEGEDKGTTFIVTLPLSEKNLFPGN